MIVLWTTCGDLFLIKLIQIFTKVINSLSIKNIGQAGLYTRQNSILFTISTPTITAVNFIYNPYYYLILLIINYIDRGLKTYDFRKRRAFKLFGNN